MNLKKQIKLRKKWLEIEHRRLAQSHRTLGTALLICDHRVIAEMNDTIKDSEERISRYIADLERLQQL